MEQGKLDDGVSSTMSRVPVENVLGEIGRAISSRSIS